ncbi:hypothetical protein D3C75_1078950 [compost metagenome]
MCVGNIAGNVEAITPMKKFSSTAMINSPAKISPSTPLLISMKAGMASANRPTLPTTMNGRRPNLSLSNPMIGWTNSMPTMIAMMISTPWSSL